jgi:hypothetical protein
MDINPYEASQQTDDRSGKCETDVRAFRLHLFEVLALSWLAMLIVAAASHSKILEIQAYVKSPLLGIVVFGVVGAFLLIPISLLWAFYLVFSRRFGRGLFNALICIAAIASIAFAMWIDRPAFIQ